MAQPTRGRTRLAPELRRAQIIESAIPVLAGREPANVTFEEIAVAAGVSRALVYNYFGDRSGLVGAVCLRCFEQLDEAIAPAFDQSLKPSQQAREWIRRYLLFAIEHPKPWSMISSATSSKHPAVQNAREMRLREVTERWGGQPEVRVLAAAFSGMLQSAVLEHENLENPIEFERLVDLISVLAWKGMSQLLPGGPAATRRAVPVRRS
ncbi:MAG: TetR/AcrR family transcriptional regulator [Acidimicrobiia bacterium]|nr:TetR/AcrR family transcriptional regulator [Acidimicrobiia bacterium]